MDYWQLLLAFTADIITKISNTGPNLHIGLVSFGRSPVLNFRFDTFYDNVPRIINMIKNTKYLGGSRFDMNTVFSKAMTWVFDQPGDRDKAPNVVVLITDTNSAYATINKTIKTENRIITVGVNVTKMYHLVLMASEEKDVILVEDFPQLNKKIPQVFKRICEQIGEAPEEIGE